MEPASREFEEISGRKEMEMVLKDSEAKYRALVETTGTGYVILDRLGHVLDANTEYVRLTGHKSLNDIAGRSVVEWTAPHDRERNETEVKKCFEDGFVRNLEIDYITSGGGITPVEINATVIDNKGELQIVTIVRDISDRKLAEQIRQISLERQERLNQLQQALLAPGEMEQKLKMITDGVVDIFRVDFCRIWIIGPGDLCELGCMHAAVTEGPHVCHYRDKCLRLIASSGRYTHTDGTVHRRVPFGAYKIGRVASGQEHRFLTNDVTRDPRIHNHDWARELGLLSFAGYQLRPPNGETLGVLALFSTHVISPEEDAQLDTLSNAAAQVIRTAQAEEALQESEERFRAVVESAPSGIFIQTDGRFVYLNQYTLRTFGAGSADQLLGKPVLDRFHRDSHERVRENTRLLNEERRPLPMMEEICLRLDGTHFEAEISAVPFVYEEKNGAMVFFRDISERKQMEDQLRQSQKLEAIGTLAGGVAHDFNNILTSIMGYAHMTVENMRDDDPLRNYIKYIIESSERATALTQSLLAFSRRQPVNLDLVDLNDIIKGFEKLLLRLIREDIELKTVLSGKILSVMADHGQIEQVIMNLVTNAMDAMPRGGHITIRTGVVELGEKFIHTYGYGRCGEYALISVSDTGTGIDEKIKTKIFEPFFTTKGEGKGTGLGLSMAYGIVKKHDGFINVYSEPGRGTTFGIYLPITRGKVLEEEKESKAYAVKGGTETILIAEDDAALRNLFKTGLDQFGYKVIEAVDGDDAIHKFVEHKDDIKLTILDGIMPKKNGQEVYREIRMLSPHTRVVFLSGYSEDIFSKEGIQDEDVSFISKPILPSNLLKKVREVLDR
jgi:PAS domain S-box-containing protein